MTGRKKPNPNKTSTSVNLQKRTSNMKWSIRAAVAVCDMAQHPHRKTQQTTERPFFDDFSIVSF